MAEMELLILTIIASEQGSVESTYTFTPDENGNVRLLRKL